MSELFTGAGRNLIRRWSPPTLQATIPSPRASSRDSVTGLCVPAGASGRYATGSRRRGAGVPARWSGWGAVGDEDGGASSMRWTVLDGRALMESTGLRKVLVPSILPPSELHHLRTPPRETLGGSHRRSVNMSSPDTHGISEIFTLQPYGSLHTAGLNYPTPVAPGSIGWGHLRRQM